MQLGRMQLSVHLHCLYCRLCRAQVVGASCLMLSCLHTGVLAPEHSLDGDDQAGEEPAAARVYPSQSLGVSGGAPTALTGDTDMNGDMDYSSSSETGDREDEEAMSSGADSDEESKPILHLAVICCTLHIGVPL